MDRLRQDVRTAVRSLIKTPLVTLAAVLSLGLGIGANASIFSAVDVFLVRPLDFEDADQLISVYTAHRERGWTEASSSVPDFLDWRAQSRSADLAAWSSAGVNLTGTERPERLDAFRVTTNFFDVVRRGPVLGRGFTAEEEASSGSRVVILGDGLWQTRFGADPTVIGRVIGLDGEPYEVVGVMPARVGFGNDPDVWLPIRFSAEQERRSSRWLSVLGRLRPGYDLDAARAEMNAIQARLAEAYPADDAGTSTTVMSLKSDWFDEGFRQGSLIASTAVLFVLLIACANVANLLLARAAGREREIALRGALGARRGRIVRQLLTESVILALVGGVLGVALSVIGIRGLRGLFPADMRGIHMITLNGRVLFFTAAVSIVSGLLFGLAPALRSARLDLRNLLTDGGRGTTSTRGARVRQALVVAEISLALVLLICSALMVQAFVQLRTADMGFRTDVVTMNVTLPATRYATPEHAIAFQTSLFDRIAALPGVQSAGASDGLPLMGSTSRYYSVPDQAAPEPGREPVVMTRSVFPGYFETLGMPIVAGRSVSATDTRDAPRVIVINEAMARFTWGNENALGRRLRFGETDYEVVGIVGNTRDWGPDEQPPRVVYYSGFQFDVRSFMLTVRTTLPPETMASSIREAVRALDPDQPIHNVSTLDAILRQELMGSAAMMKVLGTLAVIAFVLSAVGVYGVMAYSVTQRRLEMGIRMALGAQRGSVLGIVLKRGSVIILLGIVIGLAIAFSTTRLLSFFLFGVSPFDPLAFTTVPLLLGATGLLASWLPAVRATRVSPMTALRSD